MRRDAKEQRLEALERDFRPRLIAVLHECANGRWGLFGYYCLFAAAVVLAAHFFLPATS